MSLHDGSRIVALDALRGSLAAIVVLHHVVCAFGSPALGEVARFAVSLFFVMSGFVLTRSYDGRPVAFVARRLVRLWPIYAACLTVGALVAGRLPMPSELFWFPMLQYQAVPVINHPAWTLYYEAWAALFLVPAMILARVDRSIGLLLVPLSVALVLVDLRFSCAPLFAVGVAASRFEIRSPQNFPPVTIWLGKISYSLYVTHGVLFDAADRLGGRWGVVAAFPLAFLVGWAAWWAIERPSILLSRRVAGLSLRQPALIA